MIGKTVRDVTVPPLIVGDSAFPLCSWLLKPYTNAVLTPQQHYFNYRLSRARMVTEAAYGQLKGRWRVLFRKNESSQDQAHITTIACMVLHNTCIMQGDAISRKLDLSLDESGGKRNRDELRKLLQMRDCLSIRDASREAARIRDALWEIMAREANGESFVNPKKTHYCYVVSTLHKLAAKLLPICWNSRAVANHSVSFTCIW